MIKHIKVWLVIALATMALDAAVIAIVRPVFGVDFTGGSLIEASAVNLNPLAVSEELQNTLNIPSSVQTTESGSVLIRTEALAADKHQQAVEALKKAGLIKEELRFESIGPTVGADLRKKAWLAVGLAVIGMIIYLAYEFRKAAGFIKPWKFGVAAVLALAHDLLFVMALFVVLGRFFGTPIDILFVTAMLAVMGYSVNDTIVIFNRLRYEWQLSRNKDLKEILDRAVRATLIRSLNTAFAAILTLLALFLLGGASIRWFVAALAAGTIVGTYSSIFVAPPLLYWMSVKKTQ